MSVVNEPSCKKCRRNREKLFLKGLRCTTAKCSLEKRNFPPGKNAASLQRKSSDYGVRLREKQKIKVYYGISEVQLRKYFEKADNAAGMTGHVLLALCEIRIDNVAYRSNLARSRSEARLLATHGHLLLNGKKIDVPSILVKPGDVISIRPNSLEFVNKRLEELKDKSMPAWLVFDSKDKTVSINHIPSRDEIDFAVQEHLVVEYYSR